MFLYIYLLLDFWVNWCSFISQKKYIQLNSNGSSLQNREKVNSKEEKKKNQDGFAFLEMK